MEREKLIALVKGVQKGDEAAFSEMYTAFYDDLYYYIYKTVNDPELAADLTQDSFIEIMQSIGSLQEPAACVTWSRQIAYRRCTAYFKKRHDFLADEDEDGYSVFDTMEEDRTEFIPDAALDQEDLRQTIMAMINDLPEEQRSAIMMRYFEELPLADVAKIQGVSEGTVKSRLNYGRKAIRQAVEDYEKKSGVKLHCLGVVPLLLWLLREKRRAAGVSLTTGAAKTVIGAGAAAAGGTGAAAATAAATTVAAAVGTKIVAAVVAAVLVVGGAAVGIANVLPESSGSGRRKSVSQSQDKDCTHKRCTTEKKMLAEGIYQTVRECVRCGAEWEEIELEHTDKPIHVTVQQDLISQYISEKSHQNMLALIKSQLDITEDSGITVEFVGTLYFYNEEWVEKSNINNRLVLIYHMDNGIVPGGWYSFLGINGNMAIQSYTDDDDNQYFSTVISGDYGDCMAAILLECHREYYHWLVDTDYPTSFVYEDVRYVGHQSMDGALQSLLINCFEYSRIEFDHMIASGEIKNMVTEY